jgi:uncharacterized protein YbcV (DUF1398 family)
MPDGDAYQVTSADFGKMPAKDFIASGIEAAVRASQAGQIDYREFCKRVLKAGCVFYVVSLKGRRAVYSGRTGESHVELFPGAN